MNAPEGGHDELLLAGDWIDISRFLRPETPVWPGDRPFVLERHRDGDLLVSSFATTCHIGTHVDAPLHLDPAGVGVEGVPLDRCIGPAEVVRVPSVGEPLEVEDLPQGWLPDTPRVLLRSDSHPLDCEIVGGFTSVSEELIHWLADRRVETLGVDTPSVDPFESTELAAHRALLERGMTWIEGLWLGNVEPGTYFLVALPMPLEGSDAAPVRALLKRHRIREHRLRRVRELS